MKHHVLIRSSYAPEHWTLDANRKRLAIAEAVTGHSLLSQTTQDWTLAVLVNPRDELLRQRKAMFSSAAPNVVFIEDTNTSKTRDEAAFKGYRELDWVGILGLRGERFLTTRLDDDDGLAPETLHQVQTASQNLQETTAIIHPRGVRVWDGRYSLVYHDCNAMHSLLTVAGEDHFVYGYGHRKVRELFPVVDIKSYLAWLWLRHEETLSGHKNAARELEEVIVSQFLVDWNVIESLP